VTVDQIAQLRVRLARVERVLARTVRVGEVAEVDATAARVKITLPDESDLLTAWLPVLHQRTEDGDDYAMPPLGAQVLAVFLPVGVEDGFVLGGFYAREDADAGTAPKNPHTRRLAGDWLELLAETSIDMYAPDINATADNDIVLTAPVVAADANLVQLGSLAPADFAALASKVQAMDTKIATLLASQVFLSAMGPVPSASDVTGTDGTAAGGTVAVTTSWKVPVTGPIAQEASAVVEID
jgi:phage baseplate assembly protein V